MLSFLFGKKKTESKNCENTIQKLKETLILLEKRESHLLNEIEKLRKQAIGYNNKNKNMAILSLKKAKLYEKQYDSISGQKFNIETQISALTQTIINKETINALSMGKNVLNKIGSELDPDKVSDIVDDIGDNMEKIKEVTEAISRPVHDSVDEDELIEELNELTLLEKPDILNKLPNLPNVPDKVLEEEKELEKLHIIMNS